MISSFKTAHPEFGDREVNEMRAALLKSGDIEKVYGLTRQTRYRITDSGRYKLQEYSDRQ